MNLNTIELKTFTPDEVDVEISQLVLVLNEIEKNEQEIVLSCERYSIKAKAQTETIPLYGKFTEHKFDLNQPFFEHKSKVFKLIFNLLSLKSEVKYHELFPNVKLLAEIDSVKGVGFRNCDYFFNQFAESYFEGLNRHSVELPIGINSKTILGGYINTVAPNLIASILNMAAIANKDDYRALAMPWYGYKDKYCFANDDFEVEFVQLFGKDQEASVEVFLKLKNIVLFHILLNEVNTLIIKNKY